MLTHEELKQKMLENPAVKQDYDTLEAEFALFSELLQARLQAGLSQKEVAERMGLQTPAVVQLEAGDGNEPFSPSVAMLQKYAEAVGCHLEIKLVPQ